MLSLKASLAFCGVMKSEWGREDYVSYLLEMREVGKQGSQWWFGN